MNIGERIAEKIDDVIRGKGEIAFYYQSKPRRMEIFAALINQEVEKENTEDSERLDWLEGSKVDIDAPIETVSPWAIHPDVERFVGKTLREAIDAARGKTLGNETPASTDSIANRETGELENKIAAATAHRACCGSEHDPSNGKLHGLCVVCGVDWPCETARAFIYVPQTSSVATQPVIAEETKTDEEIGQAVQEIKDLFCESLPPSVVISDGDKDIIDEQLPRILAAIRGSRTAAVTKEDNS